MWKGLAFALLASGSALVLPPRVTGRRDALGLAALATTATALPARAAESIGSDGLTYTVTKSSRSSGGKPKIGDLVVVRFKGSVQKTGAVFDDIMSSPEGYYFRLGTGQVLPAVEQALPLMKSGDIWQLTVPAKLGFGEKGRQASPGRPRIESNAVLDFTLELVAVPGKDDELIETNEAEAGAAPAPAAAP